MTILVSYITRVAWVFDGFRRHAHVPAGQLAWPRKYDCILGVVVVT